MNAAKWAAALLVAFIGALTSGRASTVLLNDTFSGSSLDASLWQTILPNGSSSVTQSGGGLTTTARGILGSVAGFSGPLTLSGTFTLLNDSEHFKIVLRSDLTSTGSYDERTGLIVAFANDGDNVSIQELTNPMANWQLIAATGNGGYRLTTGVPYAFSIVDTGTSVSVSLNGAPVVSANTTWSTGNHIGFYSREFAGTGTRLDEVTVTSPVPDTASTGLLLTGALGLLHVARGPRPARKPVAR